MDKVTESTLVVELERSHRQLTKFIKNWSIDSAYLTSTDGFSFTCFSEKPEEVDGFFGLELQPVRLTVGGAQQVLGRIDISDVGDDGSAVTFEGRDYLADLVESNVDPAIELKEGMTLADAIFQVAGPVGIQQVEANDDTPLRNVRSGKFKTKTRKGRVVSVRELKMEELKVDFGLGSYDFVNRLAARFGVTIQPGDARDLLLLGAPDYDQAPLYKLIRRHSGRGNNIIKARARRDFSSVPTFAQFSGSQSRAGEESKDLFQTYDIVQAAGDFAPPLRSALEASCYSGRRKPGNLSPLEIGQLYRLLAFRDTDSRNADQLEHAAFRAVGERLKETLVYTATVQGHIDPTSGAVWSVDTIATVEDEVTRVFENVWIAQRTLNYSPEGGATTDLVCWRPGAFLT